MRGNIEKTGVRIDAKPESLPRQKGELADSASITGSAPRRPSSARTAVSASGHRRRGRAAPSSARAGPARASSPRPRGSGGPDVISTSSRDANGCVPATAARSPSSVAQRASTASRRPPSCAAASATVPCGPVRAPARTRASPAQAWAATPSGSASSTSSTRLASDQSRRVEQHQLLLDADGPRPLGGRRLQATQSACAALRHRRRRVLRTPGGRRAGAARRRAAHRSRRGGPSPRSTAGSPARAPGRSENGSETIKRSSSLRRWKPRVLGMQPLDRVASEEANSERAGPLVA